MREKCQEHGLALAESLQRVLGTLAERPDVERVIVDDQSASA